MLTNTCDGYWLEINGGYQCSKCNNYHCPRCGAIIPILSDGSALYCYDCNSYYDYIPRADTAFIKIGAKQFVVVLVSGENEESYSLSTPNQVVRYLKERGMNRNTVQFSDEISLSAQKAILDGLGS